MNRYAIQHIVDSSYCFPVSGNEIVLRLRAAKDDIRSAEVIYESKYVFGTSQRTARMEKTNICGLYDYFSIKLRLDDTRLAYVFRVDDGQQKYFFSEDGVSEQYDYSLGYYNFFQYPYINSADIMECVDWMKKASFYQIFVDRFNIGKTDKDMSYINCKWGDLPTPKTFAGGDLKGITRKLDYIRSLGCNAIYLTPVFASKSNHKYDIRDYYRVDEQFGDENDLKELVDAAHEKGIRILLDAVFNHCSEDIMQFRDVAEKGKASPYYDWFIIYGDKPERHKKNYETFGDCSYMPKWNTSNQEVSRYLIDIAVYYIEKFDIDGWRLDVSDEVSHDFWRSFRKAVKRAKKDAVIIGENWHDAYSNLRGDQYDSIMNYAFSKACLDYFASGKHDAQNMAWKLNELLMRNSDTVNNMMLNLLDSHDTHRFYSMVGEDREKVKAALCLLYLYPGTPCIYYGTEIMTPGGYDPDSRRCMDWEKADDVAAYADVFELLQKLSGLRQKYDLASGKVSIYSQNNVFILKNTLDGGIIELFINNTDEAAFAEGFEIGAHGYVVRVNGGEII